MDKVSKNKLLTWLVILLLVANAATLATFWLSKAKHPPPPRGGTPSDFLVKELALDTNQQQRLMVLVKDHREAAEQFREKIKKAKEDFFNLLKQPAVSDSIKNTAARSVSQYTEALDLLTLNHFQKVRALCTPEQQKKFDEIINEVTNMIGAPRPMGPGGRPQGPPPQGGRPDQPPPGGPDGPPPGGDRPPPPEN